MEAYSRRGNSSFNKVIRRTGYLVLEGEVSLEIKSSTTG